MQLSKKAANSLYCFCRQAALSVHRVTQNQWGEFLAFYDAEKKAWLDQLLDISRIPGATPKQMPSALSQRDPIMAIAASVIRIVQNQFRRSWSFSVVELSYIHCTLTDVHKILQERQPPSLEERIKLRMRLDDCRFIISQKLIGVPELRIIDRIEHFNQSEYVQHITLKELGVFDCLQATTSDPRDAA